VGPFSDTPVVFSAPHLRAHAIRMSRNHVRRSARDRADIDPTTSATAYVMRPGARRLYDRSRRQVHTGS